MSSIPAPTVLPNDQRDQRPHVAYLGPQGSHSHDAAVERYGSTAALVAYPEMRDVITSVAKGDVDEALVPLENRSIGLIDTVVQLIREFRPPPVTGAIRRQIRNHLIGPPGLAVTQVKTVLSQPEVIRQCRGWLAEHLSDAAVVERPSSSEAVAECASQPDTAALGTEVAAELNGLEVLARDVQDSQDNVTRFVAFGRRRAEPSLDDITSVLLLSAPLPDALLPPLAAICTRLRLERPVVISGAIDPDDRCDYLVDLPGRNEHNTAKAVHAIETTWQPAIVLGSYQIT